MVHLYNSVYKADLIIEREVNTFAYLHHASYVLLEKSQEQIEGSNYTLMSSLLLTAFAFEAYLNHLGSKKIGFWNEIERISVQDKYTVLCKSFKVEPDYSKRPHQTIRNLFKFRNALAHGKSEMMKVEKEILENDDIKDHEPKTIWEEFCNFEYVARTRDDIKQIITELSSASDEDEYPFVFGMTAGHISIK